MLYAPLPHSGCSAGTLQIGTFDQASQSWRLFRTIRTSGWWDRPFERDTTTHEVVLPEGRYGIIYMDCSGYRLNVSMSAQKPETGSILAAYRTPIAVFTVNAGEVVNVGAIGAEFVGSTGFIPVIRDIPQQRLDEFRERRPDLSKTMTTRLMQRGDASSTTR